MGVSHGCSTIFMQYQNGRGGLLWVMCIGGVVYCDGLASLLEV